MKTKVKKVQLGFRRLIAAAIALFAAAASLNGFCATNITGNVTLTADADWRGLGQVPSLPL